MTTLPTLLLPDLAWSFAEPAPASLREFLDGLQAYAAQVEVPLDHVALARRFPQAALDVEYRLATRLDSGDWDEVPMTVRLRFPKPPTLAELLHELHRAAHPGLREVDHHFFEGLALARHENEAGVPVYELRLGS